MICAYMSIQRNQTYQPLSFYLFKWFTPQMGLNISGIYKICKHCYALCSNRYFEMCVVWKLMCNKWCWICIINNRAMFSGKINMAYAFLPCKHDLKRRSHCRTCWHLRLFICAYGKKKEIQNTVVPVLCIPLTAFIFGSIFILSANSGCFDEKEVLLFFFFFN